MKLSSELRAELHALLSAVCDGRATDVDRNRLETLVLGDEAARDFYVEYIHLHAAVVRYNLVDKPSVSVSQRARLVIGRYLAITPRVVGIAASLLLVSYFVMMVGLLAWDRIHRADDHERIARDELQKAPAQLTHADDAAWQLTPNTDPSDEPGNRTLHVRHGFAELKFGQGAKVVIEGPAEFEVRSQNSGFLRRGKLLANVSKAARGFMVETPTIQIVDLGTEFGVEVDSKGTSDVQVQQGQVELRPTDLDAKRSALPLVVLKAGEATRVVKGDSGQPPLVQKSPYQANRFAGVISQSTPKQLPVADVLASSENVNHDRVARHLIDGSGLKEGRHSNFARGTMWNSAHGKFKDQFVLFDLARPRQLDSMKVWNCNENKDREFEAEGNEYFKFRGVRQADIYISNSGRGNPLSDPNEWKLVVGDHQFAMADGTPSYSTPDVVPLHNVIARFVAIVIDDSFEIPKDAEGSRIHLVALSEVQFLGLPLQKK